MNRPPRRLLLVINHLASIGGAEVQLFHLAKGLAASGYAVTLCCIGSSSLDPEAWAGTNIALVELGAHRRELRPLAIPRLTRLARQADVVHCTMWDPSLWGRLAAILARRPVMVADHATDRSVQLASNGASRDRWIALHNRLLDRFTYATVACASSQRQVLLGEGVSAEKIVHIPNGIPVEEMRRAAADGPTRQALGLPEGAPVAVQVGLFRPEKNQLGALDAFQLVRERVPDAQLVFVGEGPKQAEAEARAAAIGAGEWAHFLGTRADVPGILACADLLFLPSISDAMPMVVLEAMALGLPTVASDVGDVRQVLDERAGLCVPVDRPDLLAAACVELIEDDERRRAMGAEALRMAAHFDAGTMVERYAALFEAAWAGTAPLAALAAVDGSSSMTKSES